MSEQKPTIKKVFSAAGRFIRQLPSFVAIAIIQLYRALISPLTPSSCRFFPTCSQYGLEAFRKHGFIQGMKLTTKRILKCRPGGPYGYDPVPEKVCKHEEECHCHANHIGAQEQ